MFGLAIALLVLVVAVLSVVGVFVARGIDRAPELSLRLCLGATPSALVLEVFAESLVFFGLACSCALAIAIWESSLPERSSQGGFRVCRISVLIPQSAE